MSLRVRLTLLPGLLLAALALGALPSTSEAQFDTAQGRQQNRRVELVKK